MGSGIGLHHAAVFRAIAVDVVEHQKRLSVLPTAGTDTTIGSQRGMSVLSPLDSGPFGLADSLFLWIGFPVGVRFLYCAPLAGGVLVTGWVNVSVDTGGHRLDPTSQRLVWPGVEGAGGLTRTACRPLRCHAHPPVRRRLGSVRPSPYPARRVTTPDSRPSALRRCAPFDSSSGLRRTVCLSWCAQGGGRVSNPLGR